MAFFTFIPAVLINVNPTRFNADTYKLSFDIIQSKETSNPTGKSPVLEWLICESLREARQPYSANVFLN